MNPQIPSLGRPFQLGMLYNSLTDKLIPGRTLWNAEKIKSTKLTSEKPTSSYEVITENSIKTRFSSLGVDPNMKLSVMSGLVEVEGAAEFLHVQKSSERQCQVTLQYRSTTHFEQLDMDELGNVEYPDALNELNATHVVTGVTYGVDAFFIFNRCIKKSEQLDDVHEKMKSAVELIPWVNAYDVVSSSKENIFSAAKADDFQCNFHGDLIPEVNPCTLAGAIKLSESLPINKAKSVPKFIYLMPLSKMIRKSVNSVSVDLISRIEEIMEHIQDAEMCTNDLMKIDACKSFVDVKNQLLNLKKLLIRFKANFVEKLSQLVPQIRSGAVKEDNLADLITSVNMSPFSSSYTKKYLQQKEQEINKLTCLLKSLKKNKKIRLDSHTKECTLRDVEHVICFAFNVTSESSPYIKNLESYIETGKIEQEDDKEWFDNPEIISQLESQRVKFLQFVEKTCSDNKMAYVVTDSNRETNESGPCIILYTDGVPTPLDLPGTPQATEVTFHSITLQWTAPKYVKILLYKVLYCSKAKSGKSHFESIDSSGPVTTCCIENLLHGVEYEFKVQAITSSKFTLESEIACIETAEYYDIVLVGKTGQGKSTLGNKLLDVENTDESKIILFQSPSATSSPASNVKTPSATISPTNHTSSSDDPIETPSSTSTEVASSASTEVAEDSSSFKKKRFFQADDLESSQIGKQMLSITEECKLMSNEVRNIRVLDVPGFSDSGTLQRAAGKKVSVFDGNLQIVRWVVREQLQSQLKMRRMVYFLPVRGPLEKADGTLQEELKVLHHFFGKQIFNNMVVIATNSPKKKFQDLGFDEQDYEETEKIFHLAIQTAIGDKGIACPPIVYIGLNDSPQETLSKITNAVVLRDDIIVPLAFLEDTCALCSVKICFNENSEKILIVNGDGTVIPYAESKCHPCFVPKYSSVKKVIGGVGHILTMGMFILLKKFVHIESWPGFTNSDEVCIACNQSPGAKGCQLVGKELEFCHKGDKKTIFVTPEHSNKL